MLGWFATQAIDPTLTRIWEPNAHQLLRGNIWWIRGSHRDVVIDAGLGICSLRAAFPSMFDRDPLLVLTHAHLDHSGGAHEFQHVAAHGQEAGLIEDPLPSSLRSDEICAALGVRQSDLGTPLPTLLANTESLPAFEPESYRLMPAQVTQVLNDGDRIDYGDVSLRVLHMPGHSPGSLSLLDERSGYLYSGDTLYDGTILDSLAGSDPEDYRGSMRRLLTLDYHTVHPGHGVSFDRQRARELIDAYLTVANRANPPEQLATSANPDQSTSNERTQCHS